MSKKISIIVISIIIVISLGISIVISSKDKINTSINYSVIEKDGKFGVAQNEETIIEPQYDEIIIPNQHIAVFMCRSEENKKFVNNENKEIFTEYNNVELIEIFDLTYEKNILIYEEDGKYGLLGITGKKITDAKYEEIYNSGYKESEVVVKENGKYGVIDEKGKSKIKSKYDVIEIDQYYTDENGYKEAGYIVYITTNDGYRYGYYDSEGTQVLEEEYNEITRLTEIKGDDIYLVAAKNGQYGVFINNTKIINTQYQSIAYNSELQIFIVERTGKFGVLNFKGTEILSPEYSELQVLGIGIYTIKNEENKVFDVNGNEIDISFDTVITRTSNTNYFIKTEGEKYSIVNSKFESLLDQTYNFIEYAYDKYFIVTNEQEKVGVIDLDGNIVIDFNYDFIQLIKGKTIIEAIQFENNKTDFYDNQFDLALEISNAEVEILDNGVKIYNNEIEHFLDNNGKSITE